MKIKLFTIPNLLTLMNLLCGAVAVVRTLSCGDLTGAFWWIVLAAVFDFLDGFAARLLHCPSPLGIQLDSLADDISFGLAPGTILFVLYERMPGLWLNEWFGYIVFIFSAFAALRLAKFNVDDTQHTEFCGLPTPAATLLCTSIAMLAETQGFVLLREWVLVLAVAAAVLMISPVRMFSLKFQGFGWKGNEIRYAFLLISCVLLAVMQVCAVPVIMLLYVLISTVRWLFVRKAEK